MSRQKCRPSEHADRPVRGSADVVCTKCNDRFPCPPYADGRGCTHLDCIVATGRPLPDYVGPEARDAILSELEAIYAVQADVSPVDAIVSAA